MHIPPVGSPWDRPRQRELHDLLSEHWQDVQLPAQQLPPRSPESGSWQLRDVLPLASAGLLMQAGEPIAQGARQIIQNLQIGQVTPALAGAGRLLSTVGRNAQTVQSVSQGLHEMFMAFDRNRQAQIEAQVKQAQAQKERGLFYSVNGLSDVVSQQAAKQQMLEIRSNILAKQLATQSLIIRNL